MHFFVISWDKYIAQSLFTTEKSLFFKNLFPLFIFFHQHYSTPNLCRGICLRYVIIIPLHHNIIIMVSNRWLYHQWCGVYSIIFSLFHVLCNYEQLNQPWLLIPIVVSYDWNFNSTDWAKENSKLTHTWWCAHAHAVRGWGILLFCVVLCVCVQWSMYNNFLLCTLISHQSSHLSSQGVDILRESILQLILIDIGNFLKWR